MISLQDFQKVCLSVGRSVACQTNQSAQIPAYHIQLSFGHDLDSFLQKTYKRPHYHSSAQLCANHKADQIIGSLMLSVLNFPRKQVGKVMSDCLVTGVQKDCVDPLQKRNSTVFMTTSSEVAPGSKVGILAENIIVTCAIRSLEWGEFTKLDLRIGTIHSIESVEIRTLANTVKQVLFRIDLNSRNTTISEGASEDLPPNTVFTSAAEASEITGLEEEFLKLSLTQELKTCVGILQPDFPEDSLIGSQVLVLTNLNEASKEQLFNNPTIDSVLCTVAGSSVLTPAIPVENGFKLA